MLMQWDGKSHGEQYTVKCVVGPWAITGHWGRLLGNPWNSSSGMWVGLTSSWGQQPSVAGWNGSTRRLRDFQAKTRLKYRSMQKVTMPNGKDLKLVVGVIQGMIDRR